MTSKFEILLPVRFVPEVYNVELNIDFDNSTFSGVNRILLIPGNKSNSILRRRSPTIDALAHIRFESNDELILHCDKSLTLSNVKLNVLDENAHERAHVTASVDAVSIRFDAHEVVRLRFGSSVDFEAMRERNQRCEVVISFAAKLEEKLEGLYLSKYVSSSSSSTVGVTKKIAVTQFEPTYW